MYLSNQSEQVVVVGPGGIIIPIPEQFPIDLHPRSAIVLSHVVLKRAAEGHLLVGIGIDSEAGLAAGQPSRLQVMHLQLTLPCLVNLSNLRSCPSQVVGIRPHGTLVMAGVPSPATPRVPPSARYEGKPSSKFQRLAVDARRRISPNLELLVPSGRLWKMRVLPFSNCSKLMSILSFSLSLKLRAARCTRWRNRPGASSRSSPPPPTRAAKT